jgi:dTDP-4-amino-4,6-dideoxygalactose transaminase
MAATQVLSLPVHPSLSKDNLELIVKSIKSCAGVVKL